MTGSDRGPYAKTLAKRALVAHAALEVVLEVGHAELTAGAVAARAGMSERTLQYHFPTRDHLLVAALALHDEEQSRSMPFPDDLASLDLASIPATIAQASVTQPRILALSNALAGQAGDPEHPAHAFFAQRDAASIAALSTLVRTLQDAGNALPDLDPDATARQLVALWIGLERQWLVRPEFDLVAEIVALFRLLTGQQVMETRQALLSLAEAIA
ncbi:MAG: TetR/AcrR family transcriptional regulator [Propionibacteriaceae bacterium]|nr:TetR/AcrR family transcriptional regulator [Propionibacteriaceae bacterium]